ncbi:MAG: IPT/TIG domain-containing protein [Acidobacteriota bacterium]|nr:IPT/TIG domain-containing protein [Acidobacteriota bacterium]
MSPLRIVILAVAISASLPAVAQTIASITPNTGPVTGGTTVIVKGSGFTQTFPCPVLCGPPSLGFGQFATFRFASHFTIVDDSTIVAVTPPMPAGYATVELSLGDFAPIVGLEDGFRFVAPAEVPLLDPRAAMALCGALAVAALFVLRRQA